MSHGGALGQFLQGCSEAVLLSTQQCLYAIVLSSQKRADIRLAETCLPAALPLEVRRSLPRLRIRRSATARKNKRERKYKSLQNINRLGLLLKAF